MHMKEGQTQTLSAPISSGCAEQLNPQLEKITIDPSLSNKTVLRRSSHPLAPQAEAVLRSDCNNNYFVLGFWRWTVPGKMPKSVIHTCVSHFLRSASVLPWFCWGHLEWSSELLLVWGAGSFCPETVMREKAKQNSNSPPSVFSSYNFSRLPPAQTNTSTLQYTSSKKALSHHRFCTVFSASWCFSTLALWGWDCGRKPAVWLVRWLGQNLFIYFRNEASFIFYYYMSH